MLEVRYLEIALRRVGMRASRQDLLNAARFAVVDRQMVLVGRKPRKARFHIEVIESEVHAGHEGSQSA